MLDLLSSGLVLVAATFVGLALTSLAIVRDVHAGQLAARAALLATVAVSL